MSHPLLWLFGFYALDKMNQQSKALKDCSERIKELESQHVQDGGDIVEISAINQHTVQDSADGCLEAFMFLVFAIPICCVILYLLFFTTAGHIVLVLIGVLLLLALIGKKKG